MMKRTIALNPDDDFGDRAGTKSSLFAARFIAPQETRCVRVVSTVRGQLDARLFGAFQNHQVQRQAIGNREPEAVRLPSSNSQDAYEAGRPSVSRINAWATYGASQAAAR